MTFDKQKYWKRRNSGLRGQEPYDVVVGFHIRPDWPRKAVSKKAIRKNTKRARKAALQVAK